MRCVGGEVGATSSLAPKIGPLGLVSFFSLKNKSLITNQIVYTYLFTPLKNYVFFSFKHYNELQNLLDDLVSKYLLGFQRALLCLVYV